jgi:hypothetical protein
MIRIIKIVIATILLAITFGLIDCNSVENAATSTPANIPTQPTNLPSEPDNPPIVVDGEPAIYVDLSFPNGAP